MQSESEKHAAALAELDNRAGGSLQDAEILFGSSDDDESSREGQDGIQGRKNTKRGIFPHTSSVLSFSVKSQLSVLAQIMKATINLKNQVRITR